MACSGIDNTQVRHYSFAPTHQNRGILQQKDANETEFAMIAEFFVLHCSVRLDRGLVVYKTSYMAELEDSCREKVIWHKSRLGTSFI